MRLVADRPKKIKEGIIMSAQNHVNLMGRLTRNPENKSKENLTIAKFSLAVDRRAKKNEEKTADFFNCTAFGKTAECILGFCTQGTKILVSGYLQVNSYERQDGTRVNATEVILEEFAFCESKKAEPQTQAQAPVSQGYQSQQGFPPQGQPMQAQPQGTYSVPQGYQMPQQAPWQQVQPQGGFIPQGQPPVGSLQINPQEKGFIN